MPSRIIIFNVIMPTAFKTQNSAYQQPTFASLNALGPCVVKLCVACISTVLEPSTAASTTAAFAKFLRSTTLGA